MVCGDASRLLAARGQAREQAFHGLDAPYVDACLVIAALLASRQPQPSAHVEVTSPLPAQMNDRSQVLLLLQGGKTHAAREQSLGHGAVEICGCHLDRIARDYAHVETVEPARMPIVPAAVLDDVMVVNAIVLRLRKRPIRQLVHAHRARGRAVYLEGMRSPRPAPVGTDDRVAGSFHLSQGS